MNPDNNWKDTRASAEDLSLLLGVSVQTVEDFLVVLENLIIHKYVEELSKTDESTVDINIELPYLGSLVVSTNEKGQISTSFAVRRTFYRKLKKATNLMESPLTSQLCKILGNQLVEKFEEGMIDERNNKT